MSTSFPAFEAASSAITNAFPSSPEPEKAASILGGKEVGAAKPRVLVVDDENLIADSVAEILNRNGFDADARYSGMAAIAYLELHCPDIIVTDVILPDLDGVSVAKAAHTLCRGVRIVLLSGNVATTPLLDLALIEGHSFELLAKPVHPAVLLKTLRA